jgi:hypothetical protein
MKPRHFWFNVTSLKSVNLQIKCCLPNNGHRLRLILSQTPRNISSRCTTRQKTPNPRCLTGLNNVLLPTYLFTLVNNIEQCCWAWIGCNNIVQYCWQLWTMWVAKHCSILFSSVLQQPERFYTTCTVHSCHRIKTHRRLTQPNVTAAILWFIIKMLTPWP